MTTPSKWQTILFLHIKSHVIFSPTIVYWYTPVRNHADITTHHQQCYFHIMQTLLLISSSVIFMDSYFHHHVFVSGNGQTPWTNKLFLIQNYWLTYNVFVLVFTSSRPYPANSKQTSPSNQQPVCEHVLWYTTMSWRS